ncbi:MAG: HDOD domain-containing protein [Acidobacteria bacterium]|nr:HDOD domain-containing protein [Acidobacteriota bacterium]
MSQRRILFVDDESAVLDGLRNLLRKDRSRWDMVFACGGSEALAELRKAEFDIVVSDMRMPGMDGAELLTKVKAEHPGAARIVLSGHAEREAILRALPVAHQFLSKPCDVQVLRSAIERTCDLHRLIQDEKIRAVVGNVERLPSVSRTYRDLADVAANPAAGIADVAEIVQRDPAISVKVLQMVNSAYFGVAQSVTSIRQACNYLGLELLKGIALTTQIFSVMEAKPVEGFSLERLQTYSLQTARLAKRFLADSKLAEEAFTAALVHDIGRIIIALGLPGEFASIAREVRTSGRPFHLVEEATLGVTHAEVGAYLLGVWGLPFSIVECVAYHHRPGALGEGPCGVLAAVHAADALVDTTCTGETLAPIEERLDVAFLDRAGYASNLATWRALAAEEILKTPQVAGVA